MISTLYNEEKWPDLWQGLYELNENDDPSILLKSAEFQLLGADPTAARFPSHVNRLDGWSLHPELDRATRLDDAAKVAAAFAERLPLLAAVDSYSRLASPSPFYDQFAPEPLAGPLDGGGVPILVIGNRSDPATPFSESEEFATETLSNGYLVETSHFKHIVYPGNQCVNNHVHRALIDGKASQRAAGLLRGGPHLRAWAEAGAGACCYRRADRLEPVRRFRVRVDTSSGGLPNPEAGSINIALNVHRATSPDKRIAICW